DALTWKDDLGNVAREMADISRRLELLKGGPKTRKKQSDVIAALDKLIKEKEDQANSKGQGQGEGKQGSQGNQGSKPMQDSQIANNSGPGNVNSKKLKETAEVWGKLTERERAQTMMELTRDLPPRYREIIER